MPEQRISDIRPIASLTGGLLARKGAARPAMRSSLHVPDHGLAHGAADDLGWNDFGAQEARPEPAHIVPLAANAEPAEAPAEPPLVVRQQQAIAEAVAAEAAPAPTVAPEPAPAPALRSPLVRKSALAQGRRAAFTLRLDSERHLALRVAATVLGRSAQQIVSDALDDLIARHPEIHTIAGQIHGRR